MAKDRLINVLRKCILVFFLYIYFLPIQMTVSRLSNIYVMEWSSGDGDGGEWYEGRGW